jgi:U3 small nucleolar RNA-associated protein 18
MNAKVCVHKFVDDGCIKGTSIAISPTQQYLACGSSSGVVNLYNTSQLENNSLPKPDKGKCLFLFAKISPWNNFFLLFCSDSEFSDEDIRHYLSSKFWNCIHIFLRKRKCRQTGSLSINDGLQEFPNPE